LVRRWSPESLRAAEGEALLQMTLVEVRTRMRAFFDRVFA
jgi:hypothetical protein